MKQIVLALICLIIVSVNLSGQSKVIDLWNGKVPGAVNQDALGKQATCVQTIGDLRIYAKDLEDGSRVAGFCNFGLENVDISYKDLNKLGISGKQKVRDLWRQKDITTIHADKEALSVKVPMHGVTLYKFTPVK